MSDNDNENAAPPPPPAHAQPPPQHAHESDDDGGDEGDDGPDIETLGVSTDDIREFALGGLRRRLEIIGVPIETL